MYPVYPNESIFTLKEAMKNHPNFTVKVRAHVILLSNHRIKIQNIAKFMKLQDKLSLIGKILVSLVCTIIHGAAVLQN